MKKVLVYSSVVLLLLAGCSSKTPTIDESAMEGASQMESAADADSVVIDDSEGVSSTGTGLDGAEASMSALEKQMASIYFAFDKYDISPEASATLQGNAMFVNAKAAKYNIKIEGNCDEWGSDEYNFALGLKRAKAAKDVLVAEGVHAERISMVSYGESNPVCVEKTVACWAKNRRDDFKLLP
jgi:peptidoglycan-associated lipoprotein